MSPSGGVGVGGCLRRTFASSWKCPGEELVYVACRAVTSGVLERSLEPTSTVSQCCEYQSTRSEVAGEHSQEHRARLLPSFTRVVYQMQ